jgi:hypothetical protein
MPGVGTVACPYCNAFVPVPAGTAAGRRLACPRCGEAFAFLPRDGVTDSSPPGVASNSSSAAFSAEPASLEAPDRDTLQAKVRQLIRNLQVMAGERGVVGGA